MLATTSKQRPTVYNDQPDPQLSKMNYIFLGTTPEQRPPLKNSHYFWLPLYTGLTVNLCKTQNLQNLGLNFQSSHTQVAPMRFGPAEQIRVQVNLSGSFFSTDLTSTAPSRTCSTEKWIARPDGSGAPTTSSASRSIKIRSTTKKLPGT